MESTNGGHPKRTELHYTRISEALTLELLLLNCSMILNLVQFVS